MAIIRDPSTPERVVPSDQLGRPEGQQIVYLLRPPRSYDQINLKRAAAEHGARRHGPLRLMAIAREAIVALMDEGAEKDTLLAVVDGYAVWIADHYGKLAAGVFDLTTEEGGKEYAAAVGRQSEFEAQLADVMATVRQHWPAYRRAAADDEVYWQIIGTETARLMLVGWENRKVAFATGPAGVSDALLATIPENHRVAIGIAGSRLMAPSEDEEKNSVSRSRSTSGATSSPKGRSTTATIRSKGTSGRSPKSASPS